MPLTLDSFRGIEQTRGFLRETEDHSLEVVGDHKIFGKIGALIADPGTQANISLKQQFVDALEQEYGSLFATYHADRLGTGMLSVADVGEIISLGDQRAERQAEVKRQVIALDVSVRSQEYSISGLKTAVRDQDLTVLLQEDGIYDLVAETLDELGFTPYLNAINTNAEANDTGLHLRFTDIIGTDHAAELDERIKTALTEKHGDDLTKLTDDEVRAIVRDVLRNDTRLAGKLELLGKLAESGLEGADRDFAADALLRNEYRSFSDFLSITGRTPADPKSSARLTATPTDKSFLDSGITDAIGQAVDAPEDYDPAGFFDALSVDTPTGSHKAFHINRSVLMHFAETVAEDNPEAAMKLGESSLEYMVKFAPVSPDAVEDTSPAVQKADTYSRTGGNSLTFQTRAAIARELGVHYSHVTPVTDGRVMDVVKRELAQGGEGAVLDWDEDALDSIVEKMILDYRSQLEPDDPFYLPVPEGERSPMFIDVSEFVTSTLHGHTSDRSELSEALLVAEQLLSDAVDIHLARYIEDAPDLEIEGRTLDPPVIFRKQGESIIFGSVIKVGDQDVLYTTGPTARTETGAFVKPHNSYTHERIFKGLVSHNGFTVGPGELFDHWMRGLTSVSDPISSFAQIAEALRIEDVAVDFSGAEGSKLKTFGSMDDFTQTQIYLDFKALGGPTATGAPYEKVLSGVTTRMLEGFADIDLFGTMAEAGLEDLLTYELNHIQYGLQHALAAARSGHIGQFLDAINLVQADISTLLSLASPYTAEDFHTELSKVAAYTDIEALDGIKPEFMLKNSGMRGLASVLSGVERLKSSDEGPLHIAVLKSSYYESAINVESARSSKTYTLDDTTHADSAVDIASQLSESGDKLDLFVTEFHHNIGMGVDEYVSLDVAGQIKSLLASDAVSEKFTVAIDNTISDPDGAEIRALLSDPVIAEAVKEGRLNIVFYRSAQKFDMAGLDNYNGGIVAAFNDGEAFADFMDGMRRSGDEEDGISDKSLQGLTYIQKYARAELSAYRAAVFENTRLLRTPYGLVNKYGFRPDMFLTPEHSGRHFLQITPNRDPGAVFLDLRSTFLHPDDPLSEGVYGSLQRFLVGYSAQQEGRMAIQSRPSFGFAHSNVTVIGGDRFRFNPGLEKPETIGLYRDVINRLNTVFDEVLKAYPDHRDFAVMRVSRLMSAMASDPQKADLLHSALTDPTASAESVLSAAEILHDGRVDRLADQLLQTLESRGAPLTPDMLERISRLTESLQLDPDQ